MKPVLDPLFRVGDTVAYSRAHLRSCGIWQAEFADRRGTVMVLHEPRRGTVMVLHEPRRGVPDCVTVRWRDNGDEQRILACNLVLANRLHLEPR